MLKFFLHPAVFALLNMAGAYLIVFGLKAWRRNGHFWRLPACLPVGKAGRHGLQIPASLRQPPQLYQEAHWPMPWPLFLVLAPLAAFAIFWFLQQSLNVVLSLLGTLFIGWIFYFFLLHQKQKYQQKLLRQMPPFLQALANALEAGYTLPKAFVFIVNDLEAPLKPEIEMVVRQLELHLPLPEALEALADRLNAPDISFFVQSTKLHYSIGGNLIILFKKIANLIEMRHKLEQDLKTFTSQGRISGLMIASLWFISLLLFSIIAPTHLQILFHTSQGQTMLTVSLFLEAIGFYIIWKMTHFDFA